MSHHTKKSVRDRWQEEISQLVTNRAETDNASEQLEGIVSNFRSTSIRNEELEGIKYTVVPMVMLTTGVHNGSRGPLLYEEKSLANNPSAWDHKPIVVNHPFKKNQAVSACSPEMIEKYKVGIIMNTRYEDGKLKAEAYIQKERALKVDKRVWNAVETKRMMELSTGVVVANVKASGKHNGEEYVGIATNFQPDHLAILPDSKGACSIADGAGFVRNMLAINSDISNSEKDSIYSDFIKFLSAKETKSPEVAALLANETSHEETRQRILAKLQEKFPSDKGYAYPWIESVYDDSVVYCMGSNLFSIRYSDTDKAVTLSGEPVKVIRKMDYVTLSEGDETNVSNSQNKMKQKIDDLIANGGYSEADRAWLSKQDEATIDRLGAVVTANVEKGKKSAPATKGNPAPTTMDAEDDDDGEKKTKKPEPKKKLTVNEYIDEAPPELREVLTNGQNELNAKRKKLVDGIVANKANKFSAEALQAMPIASLENIAALAVNTEAEDVANGSSTNYRGLGSAAPVVNSGAKLEALAPTTIDWSKRGK